MSQWQPLQSWTISSVEELGTLLQSLESSLTQQTVVALEGPVGAGKTTLVHELLRTKSQQQVASPTFALRHHYSSARVEIEHWDLYRLHGPEELELAGFWDSFSVVPADGKSHWIFVEWSEKIAPESWPRHWQVLRLQIVPAGNVRQFHLSVLRFEGP